jgi:hypothetical protein
MVLSMLLLLVPIFLFVGVYRLLGHEDPPVVDTSVAFRAARTAAVFPVASPTQLPAQWRVVSSDFGAGDRIPTLRLGLRAPGGGGVQLIESAQPVGDLVEAELGEQARVQGEVQVAGHGWRRYAGAGGVRALVLAEPARTVIVVGNTKDRYLTQLAGALV